MKDILESSEAFTAHATIGAAYFQLGKINEEWSSKMAQSPIDKMIYASTGYGDDLNKRYSLMIVETLQVIIDQKKFIEADYSKDQEMMDRTLQFLATKIKPGKSDDYKADHASMNC